MFWNYSQYLMERLRTGTAKLEGYWNIFWVCPQKTWGSMKRKVWNFAKFANVLMYFSHLITHTVNFKKILGPTFVDNQLLFWKYIPTFLCFIRPHFGPPLHFFLALWANSFGPLWLFLGFGSGSKAFLDPTNLDYQFLIWKYSSIISFLIRPILEPFLRLMGPSWLFFWVGVRFKKLFWDLLT